MRSLTEAEENTDLNLVLTVINGNNSIPVIVTDEENKIQIRVFFRFCQRAHSGSPNLHTRALFILQILNQAMGDKQRSCDNNYRNSNKYELQISNFISPNHCLFHLYSPTTRYDPFLFHCWSQSA